MGQRGVCVGVTPRGVSIVAREFVWCAFRFSRACVCRRVSATEDEGVWGRGEGDECVSG